jgi:hypothetical protein
MNHLVFLDPQASELEKILSEVKTMLVKDFDPTQAIPHPINPGDSLYFLRDMEDCTLRVKATVVRVLFFINGADEDLSNILKEMQSRLQLTETQYNHWSAKKQVLLIEFMAAQKTPVIHVTPEKTTDRSDWIPFEAFGQIV